MSFASLRLIALLAAFLVLSPAALRAGWAVQDQIAGASPAITSTDLESAVVEYRRALAEYLEARQRYAAVAEAYWTGISEKRHLRISKRGTTSRFCSTITC